MNINELIHAYVKLRDKKAALQTKAKEEQKPIDDMLEQIEAAFLKYFIENGCNSVSANGAGTAYVSTRKTASVADKGVFVEFVFANDASELLDVRVNKTAAEQYLEEHGELPPGINMRSEQVVNFRRS